MPEINLTPKKDSVSTANKMPLAYMLLVCIALLAIVTTMYFRSNSINRNDCLQTIVSYKTDIAELKAENKELREMIVSMTKDFNSLKKNTDSVIKSTINNNHNLKP